MIIYEIDCPPPTTEINHVLVQPHRRREHSRQRSTGTNIKTNNHLFLCLLYFQLYIGLHRRYNVHFHKSDCGCNVADPMVWCVFTGGSSIQHSQSLSGLHDDSTVICFFCMLQPRTTSMSSLTQQRNPTSLWGKSCSQCEEWGCGTSGVSQPIASQIVLPDWCFYK